MRLARVLVRLYPAAFQRQWGADMEAEIGRAGWRSWPNTVAGIADLWLHPAIWPTRSPAQRQLRMTTMAITLTAAFWYISHLVTELDGALSSGVGHSPLMPAGTGLMLAGLLLIAPHPRPAAGVLALLLRGVARRFAVPCALATVIVIAAHTQAIAHASQLLRVILVACWWIALALGAIQTCRTIIEAPETLAAAHRHNDPGHRLRRGDRDHRGLLPHHTGRSPSHRGWGRTACPASGIRRCPARQPAHATGQQLLTATAARRPVERSTAARRPVERFRRSGDGVQTADQLCRS
jgi:hypothetical protein